MGARRRLAILCGTARLPGESARAGGHGRLVREEAERTGLRRGPAAHRPIPAALGWFPWARLPEVHWSDTGAEVPAEVLTWLIVQNVKLKSSEAGPLLRRYCALFVPREREELGRFVLAGWLDQDLKRKHSD